MTKKDYIVIACALNQAKPASDCTDDADKVWHDTCLRIAKALRQDNSRFNFGQFATACGVELTESEVNRSW